jgi:hypothetical protein
MDALKALRSVASGGVNYQNYAPRVLDAKVKVDRYFETHPTEVFQVRNSIYIAMKEYQLAASVWNTSIFGKDDISQKATNGIMLATDPVISQCRAVAAFVEVTMEAARRKNIDTSNEFGRMEAYADFVGANKDAIQPLWACAAAKIDEADKLITR